jgi:hypothetical protein
VGRKAFLEPLSRAAGIHILFTDVSIVDMKKFGIEGG